MKERNYVYPLTPTPEQSMVLYQLYRNVDGMSADLPLCMCTYNGVELLFCGENLLVSDDKPQTLPSDIRVHRLNGGYTVHVKASYDESLPW